MSIWASAFSPCPNKQHVNSLTHAEIIKAFTDHQYTLLSNTSSLKMLHWLPQNTHWPLEEWPELQQWPINKPFDRTNQDPDAQCCLWGNTSISPHQTWNTLWHWHVSDFINPNKKINKVLTVSTLTPANQRHIMCPKVVCSLFVARLTHVDKGRSTSVQLWSAFR